MNKNKSTRTMLITSEVFALANIPPDADLAISCEDGRIVISESDVLDSIPAELLDLFEELGIGEDAVRAVLAEDNGILEALTARET